MKKVDREAFFELLAKTTEKAVADFDDNVENRSGAVHSETKPAGSPNSRATIEELQESMQASQQLLSNFAPERYTYMGLIGLFALIAVLSTGKLLVLGAEGNELQYSLVMVSLGSIGATLLSCVQLFKIKARTFDFIREMTSGEPSR